MSQFSLSYLLVESVILLYNASLSYHSLTCLLHSSKTRPSHFPSNCTSSFKLLYRFIWVCHHPLRCRNSTGGHTSKEKWFSFLQKSSVSHSSQPGVRSRDSLSPTCYRFFLKLAWLCLLWIHMHSSCSISRAQHFKLQTDVRSTSYFPSVVFLWCNSHC